MQPYPKARIALGSTCPFEPDHFHPWRSLLNLDPSAFVADPELIHGLEGTSDPVSCSEECILFRQGDASTGLYILKSGSVTLTMSSPIGKRLLSISAAAGSLLGLPALIGDEPYTLTAIAHAGAQLSYLPRDSFTALMRTNPLLALKVLRVLAAEVRSARSALHQGSAPSGRRRGRLTPERQP